MHMPCRALDTLRCMDQLTVRLCRAEELEHAPAFPALSAEYLAESGRAITSDLAPQMAIYKANEAAGTMKFAGAWLGDELVGFLVLVLYVVPHFGKLVASTESLFVAQSARGSGAGTRMLKEAQSIAADSGCVGLCVSAPVGGRLAKVLPRSGFLHTNELFFKALA